MRAVVVDKHDNTSQKHIFEKFQSIAMLISESHETQLQLVAQDIWQLSTFKIKPAKDRLASRIFR
jgi:hypothetical protein